MNLGDLRLNIFDTLGYYSSPDSTVTRRIDRYINTSHREILTRKQMGKLRRWVLPFSCVANSPFAVLPQAAVMILAIADRTTNRILDEISLQDLRARDPGLQFSSTIPDAYVVLNMSSSIAADPAAATQLFVQSDSAADGAGLMANIEGTITGGYFRRAQVSMNGLTQAAVDANTAWIHISKFYLTGKCTGNVTLLDSGSVELARIAPGRTRGRYTTIHLSGTPAAIYTYYADVELHVEDMINPSDEPYTPEDYDWLLECGALRLEYQRRGTPAMAQWKVEQGRWEQGVRDLQSFVTRQTGVARGNRKTGFSQLGWAFKAGS